MNKVEEAVRLFHEGFSCSQAIASAFGPELGLETDACLKVGGAFGGGMGCMAETCGAVTGAFILIGLRFAPVMAADRAAKDKTYEVVREFTRRFRDRHDSVLCRELLGYDISTSEGMRAAKEGGLIATLCPKFVRDAAEIVQYLLSQE